MPNVASFKKNSREEVRVTLDDFRGHELINIRVWYDDGSGEYRPGKQGIALRIELLPDLQAALGAASQKREAA